MTTEPRYADGPADGPQLLEWIRQAKKGDVESFRKVYDRFASKVLNFTFRLVKSAEEAEELTQETFVAVFQKLGSLRDETRFEPWLFRIARNFCYQRFRSRGPKTVSVDARDDEGQIEIELVDTRKTPDEAFQSVELEEIVERVIADLPDKYREVFVLAAIQRLSYQEIAEIVGRSLAGVKTDIHRARLEVRRRVKDYLGVSQA